MVQAKKRRKVKEVALSPVIQTEYERSRLLADPAVRRYCSAVWDGKPCRQVIEAGAQHRYRKDPLGRSFPICMDCAHRESGGSSPEGSRVRIGLMPGGH